MLVEADHSGNGNWFLSPQGTATFNVKTGGSTRLTVDSSGNVLVGGTSAINAASGRGYILINGSSTALLDFGVGGASKGYVYHTGTDLRVYNGEAGLLQFFTSGTERMRINSAGNVGIGTTSPDTLLHIAAATGAALRIESLTSSLTTDSIVGSVEFEANDGSAQGAGVKARISAQADNASGNDISLRFYTAASTETPASEKMRLAGSGNLGIGTGAPSGASGTTIAINGGAGQARLALKNTSSGDASGDGLQIALDNTAGGIEMRENLPLYFTTNNTERARIDSGGRLQLATTVNYGGTVSILPIGGNPTTASSSLNQIQIGEASANTAYSLKVGYLSIGGGYSGSLQAIAGGAGAPLLLNADGGDVLVGKTATNSATVGCELLAVGRGVFTADSSFGLLVNRNTNDGSLVEFRQANTTEGSISVSGTTVSYNGGHLSRWAQTLTPKDDTLVKGTVLSNLDEMNVYTDADGNPVENEQLNKVKVSDVEGDANVAGVFVNWTHDEAHDVDEINMAMTGDMIIRIAAGTTVARGDLLMSAGDGTAKPQGDDIVRAKTIAKVTSTHVTCTYADGSFCVPCVLMAC